MLSSTPAMPLADAKILVQRLVGDVMNAGRLDVLDELYEPAAARAARRWIEPLRRAFPDVRAGRIVAAWGLEDTASRMRQLGVPLASF